MRPALATLLAPLALAGCAAFAPVEPQPQAARIDGRAVYMRHCSACHGERGDGRSLAGPALAKPPRDFTTLPARENLSREYMIAIVRDGRPHSPMTARGARLAQEDIEAAVDYIRASFMKAPGAR